MTAHGLKAFALAEQCRALELQAKAGSSEGAAGRIDQIAAEFARARDELEAIRTAM